MKNGKFQAIYAEAGAEALFLECDFLRRYLTDFYSTDGYVVLTDRECVFFADPRYFEAAEKRLKGSPVRVAAGAAKEAMEYIAPYTSIGVPYPFMSLAAANKLTSAGHELRDCMPALQHAMIVKTEEELSRIAKACEIAEAALSRLFGELKEGMAEREAAALLEYFMRDLGASGVSFETICAFGENASVPHYETSDRKLRFGDAVLIDFGCKYEGYCSDCTRTFLFGDDKQHEDFKKIYGCVLEAHMRVLEKLRAGMTGKEADEIARACLREHGLAEYFTHSLGHGVGLQIHEAPTLSPRGETVLEDGMVFSDEPGVYLAGKLGIRIEDTVTLKGGNASTFMKTEKKLIVL